MLTKDNLTNNVKLTLDVDLKESKLMFPNVWSLTCHCDQSKFYILKTKHQLDIVDYAKNVSVKTTLLLFKRQAATQ